MKEIGKRLKELLDEKGLTSYKLSKRIPVSQSTLSRIINKNTSPNESNLKAIIDFFKVNETWLLTGEGEKLNYSTKSKEQETPIVIEKNGVSININEIANFVASNEEEFMKIKTFSNIIEVRVAKKLAEITISKESLAEYLNSDT